jgi:hypothetical protein
MKKQATIIILAMVCTLSGTSLTQADTLAGRTTTLPSDCTLSVSDFAPLQSIQNDPTLTPEQELSQELTLRKQLLTRTIDCAKTNAHNLQSTLNAVAKDDGVDIKNQLSDKLSDALNFYDIQSAKLDTAGIRGTQAIAKEMQAWRTTNYAPLEGQISNFILWTNNQSLFQTAQNRFTQTSRVVGFIENAVPGTGLEASLTTARGVLADAQEKNAIAKNSLAQFQSPDQTFDLIQQSLQSLANAYKTFSDLNKSIQKLLPTS